MSLSRKSLDSAIRQKLNDDEELRETQEPGTVESGTHEVFRRYDMWLAHLIRQNDKRPVHLRRSEKQLKEDAAELACLNRRQRRKVFKHSSPKLPKLMTVPKGK